MVEKENERMPFLENFISTIQHQSLLEVDQNDSMSYKHISSTIETEQFDLPILPALESSIEICQEKGLSPGHTIELIGASEGAASYIMTQLAQHALKTTESHVIYLDVAGHYRLEHDHRHFHLFYSKAFVYRLASWFESHADLHVGWIFVQGTLESPLLTQLRKLQQKWAFVLVITSTSLSTHTSHFRFQVIQEPTLGLKLIWPLQLETMAIV
ncbi:hypothetical protein BD560DRAFT_423592 [Blakeslea trispora]|nr:hypothetical protein BD560DRAFT_423592 [Blakeslea trispora]